MQEIKAGYKLIAKAKQLTDVCYSAASHPGEAGKKSAGHESRSPEAGSSSLPPTLRGARPRAKLRGPDPRHLHK